MKEDRRPQGSKLRASLGLSIVFSLIVLLVLTITAVIIGLIVYIAVSFGTAEALTDRGLLFSIVVLIVVSIAVGFVVSLVMSRQALKPARRIIAATNRLADGDFSVRLDVSRPPEMAELADSFNRMAQELGSTELLRTDFVDNFSHEFKTPIVSIKGFAEMIRYDDLDAKEQNEYLDIIIGESARLSSLATNVLNLTKVENQAILSDISVMNVGEQVRTSVILLQKKWEAKRQDVSVNADDLRITANEEMLGQVWVNLLDNAVKFAPEDGRIVITLKQSGENAVYTIWNDGQPPDEAVQRHIFDKFYQGDTSHASAGNGLGLTLVKKIVELHRGSIAVSGDGSCGTSFTVILPITAQTKSESGKA